MELTEGQRKKTSGSGHSGEAIASGKQVDFGDLGMYVHKSTRAQRKNRLECISMLGGICASSGCRWSNNHGARPICIIRPICVRCALKHSKREGIPGILGAPQRIRIGRTRLSVEMVRVLADGCRLFPCYDCGDQILMSPGAQQAIASQCLMGCIDERALQIDHVHGEGWTDHGKGNAFYSNVKKDICGGSNKYQLLCANCQWIKVAKNGEAQGRKQHRE
jgi:hypothetical protein